MLGLRGCDASYQSNGATKLRSKLKEQGWEIRSGQGGVLPGDVVFWGTANTDANHVEIAVGTDGSTVGSSQNMANCWLNKKAEVEKACGNFWNVFYYKIPTYINALSYLKNVPSVGWAYSQCVAKFNVCPPLGPDLQEHCGYCAKIAPINEFYKAGEAELRQCVTMTKANKKWTNYAQNPNNKPK